MNIDPQMLSFTFGWNWATCGYSRSDLITPATKFGFDLYHAAQASKARGAGE